MKEFWPAGSISLEDGMINLRIEPSDQADEHFAQG